MLKGIFSLFFLLLFSSIGLSQSYPYWFIYPDKVGCDNSTIGYSTTGYYKDTSKVVAFKNGCVNFARNTALKIEGGQGFWKTENGTYWMGMKISESFDTVSIQKAESKLHLISSFSNDKITLAFLCLSDTNLTTSTNKLINLSDVPVPKWVTNLPKDVNAIYAMGMTPKYYYETSSWLEAEKQARINLAKQVSVKIQSLQKFSRYDNQEIRNEEFSVSLKNISVVERWIDAKRNIFYVLTKMPL